ncbi:MAG: FUSC family protein [Flavicella sp.]|nr:FUSC family protein [Flavicella sp.]
MITRNNKLTQNVNTDIRFLTPQDYGWNKLIVNFSLKSSIFRHSLRLSIAMVFGFLLGHFFEIQNSYWILLTLVVIMRPSYGLTKERMKHRVIGTFLGAVIALGVVYLVDSTLVFGILAGLSLILALALVQLNYRTFAMFITLHIVFMYAMYSPNVLHAIQFRIIDTLVGGGIAMLANLFLFPSWEFMTVYDSVLDTLASNRVYLKNIEKVYDGKLMDIEDYKLSRKNSFLAMGELNSAFQRMTQEPKNKRKYFSEIYDIVVLANTFLSSLASLGTFVRKHELYEHSDQFSVFVVNIVDNLTNARQVIRGQEMSKIHEENEIIEAKNSFEKKFQELTHKYDKIAVDDKSNETEISEVSLEIRQTQVILEQLSYLYTLSENLIQKISVYQNKITSDSNV